MRCRSESVKRTVVDLSFSFFIALNSYNRTIRLSLPQSSDEEARGDSYAVSLRYRPAKNFSETLHRNQDGDVISIHALPPLPPCARAALAETAASPAAALRCREDGHEVPLAKQQFLW
jgi:hypothetical protein